jgi:RNA polymerase sigma factor (sigma-70 family)
MAQNTADLFRRHLCQLLGRHNDSQATDQILLERFTLHRDEVAFEALFRRHGALVLATARRVLGNADDAEDVCQAAFLLLAQKAPSQRWQSSVANWLYKTAHLLALKARTAARRRARREQRVTPRSHANPLTEMTGQELLAALDTELLNLPEPLRAPLVLCYLQGATRDEAARHLGCPLATLKKRLERGRARLHAALVRRGLGPSVVLLGTLSTRQTADAAALCVLAAKTAQAAGALAGGQSVDGLVSAQVSQLVQGGLGIMAGHKCKAALAVLLLGGLLCAARGLAVCAQEDSQAGPPPRKASASPDPQAQRVVAAPARAPGTTLRYQFKQGDTFSYLVERKTETHSTSPGIERRVATTQTYDLTWKVASVDSDGNARMTLTLDRFRYVEDNFPGRVEFDSRKHRNPVGVPASVRILSAVLKAHAGAAFTCAVSPRGEVSAFKVPKKVADAVKGTPGVQALYSVESFRQQLAYPGSVVLPRDPVSRGTGWSEKTDLTVAGGHAAVIVETKATYQGGADREGKQLEAIALQPTATAVTRSPTTGLSPFALKGHAGKGSILFDNDNGRLVESEVSQEVDFESGGPSQPVVWKVKLNLSAKLVPSK